MDITSRAVGRAAMRMRAGGALSVPRAALPKAYVHQMERVASALIGSAYLTLGPGRHAFDDRPPRSTGGGLLSQAITAQLRALYRRRREREDVTAAGTETVAEGAITIGKPADELHRFWRDRQNLRRVMGHVAEITGTDDDRAHWRVLAFGASFDWETQIVEERPGELLRWESLPGADLPNEGSVRFRTAPGDRGTEVTLRVRFVPPFARQGGTLGEAAIKFLGVVPHLLVLRALRRFKSLVETGEIPTTEHQPAARLDTA